MVLATRFLSLVKFEHTIFALPMAYAGMLLAYAVTGRSVDASTVIWILGAMIGARTLAMALNRIVDAEIDARNPRTTIRDIPAGRVRRSQAIWLCVGALVLLLVSVYFLAPITRWLWPIPVLLFVLYPYTKRFTWLCHLVLGICNALAPVGAWLATGAPARWEMYALGIAHATWVGGFDVIYATQDVDFDRRERLHSIPARFGIGGGLWIARTAHLVTGASLVAVGLLARSAGTGIGAAYWVGTAIVIALLAYENAIVSPRDLRRINAAFFTTNGVIGIVFFLGVLLAT